MKAEKCVLHDILRFISREAETYQISQHRFALFAEQIGCLRRVRLKARSWQRE